MLRPVLSLFTGFLGVIGIPIAALVVAGGHAPTGALLAAVSVAAVGLAIWVARGRGDDGGGEDDGGEDGGGDPGDPGDPRGPLDWEAFDRSRAEWEQSTRH
jgi:hypothetical protein